VKIAATDRESINLKFLLRMICGSPAYIICRPKYSAAR
jgi:hypothetical protein